MIIELLIGAYHREYRQRSSGNHRGTRPPKTGAIGAISLRLSGGSPSSIASRQIPSLRGTLKFIEANCHEDHRSHRCTRTKTGAIGRIGPRLSGGSPSSMASHRIPSLRGKVHRGIIRGSPVPQLRIWVTIPKRDPDPKIPIPTPGP